MKNVELNKGLGELNLQEMKDIQGGNWMLWVAEKIVDALVDHYPDYKESNCGGKGCEIGMGTSGNTPFTWTCNKKADKELSCIFDFS